MSKPLLKAHTMDRMNTWRLIRATAMEYRECFGDSNVSFQAALVMVAALFEGPDVAKIAEVIGCPRETVDQIATRLTASGLWKDNRCNYQEWDPTTDIGILRFTMDHMVALGLLRRTGEKKNGQYVYALDETSPEAENLCYLSEYSNTHIKIEMENQPKIPCGKSVGWLGLRCDHPTPCLASTVGIGASVRGLERRPYAAGLDWRIRSPLQSGSGTG